MQNREQINSYPTSRVTGSASDAKLYATSSSLYKYTTLCRRQRLALVSHSRVVSLEITDYPACIYGNVSFERANSTYLLVKVF